VTSELNRTKKARIAVAVICVALATVGLLMFSQMNQVAEAAILDSHPGLVGWWRFDEGIGDMAGDSSGHGNDCTIYGAAAWVEGKHDKALSLDGTDDYVQAPKSDSLSSPVDQLSVAFWLYYIAGEMYGSYVNYQDPSGTGGWDIRTQWNDFRFRLYIGGWQELYAGAIPKNAWTHYVCTYDGEYMRVYKNGELCGTPKSQTGAITYPTDPVLWIGRNRRIADRYVEGFIDEVRVYDRVLSPAEVQEVFQKMPGFSSRLTAKVPKGTTQLIFTISWQGDGSLNVTVVSPSEVYTEENVSSTYQKTSYSSSSGDMLNIKRLAVSTAALPSDESWHLNLKYSNVEEYRITTEVQR